MQITQLISMRTIPIAVVAGTLPDRHYFVEFTVLPGID